MKILKPIRRNRPRKNKFKPFIAFKTIKNWLLDKISRQMAKEYEDYYSC